MEIKTDVEIVMNSESVALMPINAYEPKLNIKQKISGFIKRMLDIVAGLVGVIIMIPLTIIVYIAHKITNDKRTIVL